jgi:hypothetical protein
MTKRGLVSSPEIVVVKPYQMTNLGLQISPLLITKREMPLFYRSCEENCHLAFLNSYLAGAVDNATYPQLAIQLRPHHSGNNVFESVLSINRAHTMGDNQGFLFEKTAPGQGHEDIYNSRLNLKSFLQYERHKWSVLSVLSRHMRTMEGLGLAIMTLHT